MLTQINTADARTHGVLSGAELDAALSELDRLRKALSIARQIRARFPEPPTGQDKYDRGVRDTALTFLEAAGA